MTAKCTSDMEGYTVLSLFRKSLNTGIVTTTYPDEPDIPREGYRGLPEREADKCTLCGRCSEACQTGAITITINAETGTAWSLDPKRCLFCGYCVEACPEGALKMSLTYELAERATATQTAESSVEAASAVKRILGRSINIRHLDSGSCNACEWEMTTLTGPVYDIQRLGFDFVASPRHADLLMVTGPVTRNLEIAVKKTYSATPAPKIIVAVGTCACSGGICGQSYASAGGVNQILPVDIYIPGCPPRPQALIHGLLQAMEKDR